MPIEISYSIVMFMFLVQAIYAASKRHLKALLFDMAMVLGCAMPIGIWLEMYYIMAICFAIVMLANYFLAYQLRYLQNIPTNPIIIIICVVIYVIFTALSIVGFLLPCDD